jgi:hypothetical protein
LPAQPSRNDDVRGIDRDIGAAAHRDADTCVHQHRRVIDAIPDRGDLIVPLEATDEIGRWS